MPADKKLIIRKINFINNDLQRLDKLSLLSMEKFLANYEFEALAERYLERIIGRMIDINYHILSAEENTTPVDYHNSFIGLGGKYIPRELADSLADSAGLRNRLAHEYDAIDEKKVYKAMKKCMKDVPLYLEGIIKHVEKDSLQKNLL
jgi:uncharacterized protein YutE (UPF0331/DUF86 family)